METLVEETAIHQRFLIARIELYRALEISYRFAPAALATVDSAAP